MKSTFKNIFFISLLFVGFKPVFAQTLRIDIHTTGTLTLCDGDQVSSNNIHISLGQLHNNQNSQLAIHNYNVSHDVALVNGQFSGNIVVTANFDNVGITCPVDLINSVGPNVIPINFSGVQCIDSGYITFNSDNFEYELVVRYVMYLINIDGPTLPTLSSMCGVTSVNLSVPASAPSFEWWVTDDPAVPQNWKKFRDNAPNSITATVAELQPLNSNNLYQNRYVRVVEKGCALNQTRAVSAAFNFFAPAPTANITTTNACLGQNNGKIKIDGIAANSIDKWKVDFYDSDPTIKVNDEYPIADYSYLNVNAAGVEHTGLSASNYWVRVQNDKDPNNLGTCYTDYQRTITSLPQVTASVSSKSTYNGGYNLKCNGDNNGYINITPTGGSGGGYTNYSWNTNPVKTTQNISGLTAGNYTVSFTDGNGCPSSVSPIAITQPPLVTVSAHSFTNVTCNGASNGSINITPHGGVSGYKNFSWNNGYKTTEDIEITGLPPGNYTVTFQDANDCNSVPLAQAIPITQPTAVTVSLGANSNYNGYQVSCANSSDGSAVATASGGSGSGYSFQWQGIGVWDAVAGNTKQYDGLGVGGYTVKAKDGTGCISAPSTTLNLSSYPIHTVSITPVSPPEYNGAYISCHGAADGTLSAQLFDPNQAPINNPNLFEWYDNTDINNPIALGTGASIQDRSARPYKVTTTYGNNCIAQATYNLAAPAPVNPVVSIQSNHNGLAISCPGAQNGHLRASPQGGTGEFSYLWNTGVAVADLIGVGAGTYTVTATDENGCIGQAQFELQNPAPVTPSIAITSNHNGADISCHGLSDGALQASATGGTNNYSYLWNTNDTIASISALPTGTYSVTATDQNGCTGWVELDLEQPDPVTVSIDINSDYHGAHISCAGAADGTLLATGSGGTGTITYLWSTNSTTASISGLSAGYYSVTAKDVNNCTAQADTTLIEPTPVLASVAEASLYTGYGVSCAGSSDGYIRVSGTGGTGAYSYTWQGNSETTELLSGVPAGNYTATLTDQNGCADQVQHTLTEPPVLQLSLNSFQDILCHGHNTGSIAVSASGGVGQYSYSANNGAAQPDPVFNTLLAQPYTLTVRDANACEHSLDHELTEPPALHIDFTDIAPAYCKDPTGTATAVLSGGVGNYTYAWQNEDFVVFDQDPVIANLPAGIYTLTVVDDNACSLTDAVGITNTDAAKAEVAEFTEPSCSYSADGTVTLVITEGDGPFSVLWPDGQTSLKAVGLTKGTRWVKITDVNNCLATVPISLTAPDTLQVQLHDRVLPACYGDCNGQLTAAATGGTTPYLYDWGTATGHTLQNACKGIYGVTVTDAHGCTTSNSFSLAQPEPLAVQLVNRVLPLCYGGCDGTVEVTASGGNGGYRYQWDSGQAEVQKTSACAGNHSVTVTDAKGCTQISAFPLGQPTPVQVRLLANQAPDCHDGCNGRLETTSIGGTGTHQYKWTGGQQTQALTNLCAGTYSLTVTDSHACPASAVYTVINPAALTLDLGGSATLCEGQQQELDAGSQWSSYVWSSNTGFSSTAQKITIDKAGLYRVDVRNHLGCLAHDSFLLETSKDLLKASFLIPKEAIAGDTVVIIDISWPLPERIVWNFPPDMQKIKDLGDVVHGRFMKPGTYTVALDTHLGQCQDMIGKTIIILDNGTALQDNGRLGYRRLLEEFVMHPNPTNGRFRVDVQLAEQAPVTLSVWSMVTGRPVQQVHLSEQASYQALFDLSPLTPGLYIIRLDYPEGKEYIRFVVE